MTQQDTIALGHFSTAEPELLTSRLASEISLVDMVALLLRHKKLIGGFTVAATLLAAIVVWFLPPSYVAEATILPPQQQQSSLAALAAGAMGGLMGGMSSQLGLKTPADLYIGILKSRSIADHIIESFHLQAVYGTKLKSVTRKTLESHANFTSSKESLITISVRDHDANRAAGIANAFVDELYKQNSRLAITDASQRRLFFEQQLNKEKDALANAEIALKETQQSTGLLIPAGQAEVLIRSGAQIRAQIASREVQLEAMRSYATEENPQIQVVKSEISALQSQLAQVESKGASDSKLEISGSRLPEASLKYVRKLRDLKYHETLYELLAKQYEAARIDEAKQAPIVQVVDRAVVPDKDSRNRPLLVLISGLLGLIFSSLCSLIRYSVDRLLTEIAQARTPIASRQRINTDKGVRTPAC